MAEYLRFGCMARAICLTGDFALPETSKAPKSKPDTAPWVVPRPVFIDAFVLWREVGNDPWQQRRMKRIAIQQMEAKSLTPLRKRQLHKLKDELAAMEDAAGVTRTYP